MKYIGIRADGSGNKGMGHIVRCIALANEFRTRDIEPIFLTKENENVSNLLKANNIEYIAIKAQNIDEEIEEIEQVLKKVKFDYILTDSYWLSNKYLEKLNKHSNLLISIDDNCLYEYPSDIIINANIYANDLNYKIKNSKCKMLLGTKYSILRNEFRSENPIKIKPKVERIMVTMGGSDVNNFTPVVLEKLLQLECSLNIDVVVGRTFKYVDELIEIAKENKNVHLILNPANMKDIMKRCDLAISASGTTTYELAVLGIPTILISQIDNQINIAKKASQLGMMINLGKYDEIDLSEITEMVKKMINDVDTRKKMSETGISIIDSNGVSNIVNEVINYKYKIKGRDKYENRGF